MILLTRKQSFLDTREQSSLDTRKQSFLDTREQSSLEKLNFVIITFVLHIIKMLVIGKNYSYEIIREASNETTEPNTNSVVSESSVVSETNIALTHVEKVEGTLSNIITDPDNMPRYIFTNVLITASNSQLQCDIHSVPEYMVKNVQEL